MENIIDISLIFSSIWIVLVPPKGCRLNSNGNLLFSIYKKIISFIRNYIKYFITKKYAKYI